MNHARITRFDAAFSAMPLVAILRGIRPDEAEDIGSILIDSGFTLIEVPLNSPEPFDSIARLLRRFGDRALIGAGTVMTTGDVVALARIGADLVVSPHTDAAVIGAAVAAGLIAMPGAATPTECFTALNAGAHAIKLFPMEMIGATGVKAMRAILPKAARLIAVGGVDPASLPTLAAAGCDGFGLGTALYKPGASVDQVRTAAQAFGAAVSSARMAASPSR